MNDHLKLSMKDHLTMLKNENSRLKRAYEEEQKKNVQLKEMEEAEQKDQVFVENLSWGTTEQMLRSRFGQFGRLHSVKFYAASYNALVKYKDNSSIDELFQTYNSNGIKLHGAQLKCVHLRDKNRMWTFCVDGDSDYSFY